MSGKRKTCRLQQCPAVKIAEIDKSSFLYIYSVNFFAFMAQVERDRKNGEGSGKSCWLENVKRKFCWKNKKERKIKVRFLDGDQVAVDK